MKFSLNFIKLRLKAFNEIGLGGFPSTHTSIISSALFIGLFDEDSENIVYALSTAITLIVIIDALDLRNRIGLIAKNVNQLALNKTTLESYKKLKERNGHSPYEILGGLFVGAFTAASIIYLFK